MGLKDITKREAVLAAIAELNELGRDRFLEKYGFGPAHKYYLRYQGCIYDSKAIVGAAHGKQYPELGPLTADSFSGGKNTVVPLLISLNFEVIEKRIKT